MSTATAPEGGQLDESTGEFIPADAIEVIDAVAFPKNLRLRTDPLTVDDALLLTAHITATSKSLCWLVKEAKDREAWKVLGHESWEMYVEERFPFTRQHAHNIYKQAVANEAAALAVGLSAGDVNLPEWTLRGLDAEDVAAMAKDVVLSLPAGTLSKRDWAESIERGLRERIVAHKAEPASTAVDAEPAQETTTTTRASVSTTTTTKPSPPAGTPASATVTSGGGFTSPEPPAASLPEAATLGGRGEGIGAEQDPAADSPPPADLTDADAIDEAATTAVDGEPSEGTLAGASEDGPDAPPASGPSKAQVSGAFAAALTLLTITASDAAELLAGDEREDRAQDCERLADWLLAHHDAVMDRGLRAVQG